MSAVKSVEKSRSSETQQPTAISTTVSCGATICASRVSVGRGKVERKCGVRENWCRLELSSSHHLKSGEYEMNKRPVSKPHARDNAINFTTLKSASEEADNPESIIYMPSLASWRVMSSFSLVVKVASGDCLPSRSVVSKIRTYFGQEYGWGYTPVGCHGGSSKGQGHFCHLRSPWRLKRKRVCSLLEWNEEMGWDTITLCLQIEEEAAIDEMRKFTETDSGVGGRGVRG
ncbi:Uncharacterized protein Fot_25581 [Forsythia ovata]|uniref:Uncharacterized protein n=1 Tax=Forsythia ovata TaxID=205694 RepID=A0ABD1UAJ3_9LAMI